ncbi:MAG TPA: hypothetical protein VFP22_09270 [Candidatus Limnocylindrales bacterium]|nr:hypothetical protein [Candidatus Limnocylindrales bacterium]
MSHLPPSAVERRSGVDRREPFPSGTSAAAGELIQSPRLAAPSASPFVLPPSLATLRARDPWVSVVVRAIADYGAGQLDDLARSWDEGVVWHVVGGWPGADADGLGAVDAYHRAARQECRGTFRQDVVSLDASGGPIVTAHVQTHARRLGRRLDGPSLLTFELVAMRIRRVTEIPGDRAEWDAFWSD